MVGNEVKRANDDDHGEFEGTTDCGQQRIGGEEEGERERERERERWSFEATVKVKTEANSGQHNSGKCFVRCRVDPMSCLTQAVRLLQLHNLIYFSHSEIQSTLANRNTGAIAGALCLAKSQPDPGLITCDGRATMDHATTLYPQKWRTSVLDNRFKSKHEKTHTFILATHCGADRKVATVKFLRRTRFLYRLPSSFLPSDFGRKYLLKAKLTAA